jgi:hypothetical protein
MIFLYIQENQDHNDFKNLTILRYLIPCKLNKTNVINLICSLVKIFFMKLHPMKERTNINKIMKISYPKINQDKF